MCLKYLKSTVKAEPLIWNWYAWPYLIPPITAGCNIVERHIKIMQSYVQNPLVHAQAVKDPELLGGPFMDLDGQKIEEIKDLIIETKKDCTHLILLSEAYKELDKILQTEAQGDSLEELYARIPQPLKGLVELVYDLNNHPSIRIIEPFVYKEYYSHSANGQKIALSETSSDYRKFLLSTPRLNQDSEVYLNIPFSDIRLDTLFKMKYEPGDLNEIKALFNIEESKQSLFESFFSDTPPALSPDRNYFGEEVRIRYFGHACVLVQTKDVSILFDPVISYPIQMDENKGVPRYTFLDLPDKIDYVVITHNHQDHILFETLIQLRPKIGNIIFPANQLGALVDPSIKLILKHMGFSSLIEIKEMESISFPEGEIIALPFFGEHSDLNIQSKMAYSIQVKGKQILFAADSNNLDIGLYDYIFKYIGNVDVLFLGMECDGAPLTWLYGPLLTGSLKRSYDRNRTLSGSDFDKAWAITRRLNCKEVYVYAMGQEPWLGYIMALEYTEKSPQIVESNKFVKTCRENNIVSERLFGKKEWILR